MLPTRRQFEFSTPTAVSVTVAAPLFEGIRGDAQKLYAEFPERLASLQVDHLQDATTSARPHAEVQEHRPFVRKLVERYILTGCRRQGEVGCAVALREEGAVCSGLIGWCARRQEHERGYHEGHRDARSHVRLAS